MITKQTSIIRATTPTATPIMQGIPQPEAGDRENGIDEIAFCMDIIITTVTSM